MLRKKEKMKEKGITLIALIITIIVLIILAAVSIRIIYKNSMINIAVNGAKDYSDVAKREQDELDSVDEFVKKAKNRKPVLAANVKSMSSTTLVIEAKATDQDGGELTYKLYFGEDKDNLEEKEEKKAEQGIAVDWNLPGLSPAVKYYYKVEVKDEYETVTSEIMEVITRENKVPVIAKAEIADKQINSVTIKAMATDEDGDRLIYKLYLGTDASNLSEKAVSEEVAQGIEVSLTTTEYDINQTYYYRIDVTDGIVTTMGEVKEIKKNNTPVIIKVELGNKQTNSLTIKAMATDEDGDKLIYKLYLGTDVSSLSEKKVSEEVEQGTEVSLTTTEYDINKTYYYRVDVTDGKVTKEGTIKEEKRPPEVGDEVEKPSGWTSDKVTAIEDGNGGKVPLPDGYYYVGGDINTGLVISDKQGDTLDTSGVNSGNKFVWIPVPNSSYLERTEFDSLTGQPFNDLDTITYTEPFGSGYTGEASEYNTMRTQVLKYGGFYIGRYEAAVNSTTLRTTYSTAQEVVSKKGVAPYNWAPWGKSMSDSSEVSGKSGAVYLAKNKYSHPDSVTSTLPYGCQWDAMCRYIGPDGAKRSIHTNSEIKLTGSVASDVSKNIYDLAGNCYEWTMEAAGSYERVKRGGSTMYLQTLTRDSDLPDSADYFYAFRLGLYIR